jgi:hypothetical protein
MILHDFGKGMISMNENEKEWSVVAIIVTFQIFLHYNK